jgi:hypothetical protein
MVDGWVHVPPPPGGVATPIGLGSHMWLLTRLNLRFGVCNIFQIACYGCAADRVALT